MAEEIAFCNATEEKPALYLTTLSEPLEKFIFHGQRYTFFDPEKVGKSVIYEDLGTIVRKVGIEKLAEIATDMIVRYKPALVFIDSFKALNELMQSPIERRTVIYDLATVLTAYRCTSFLIGEYSTDMTTDLPEFAIADVVLSLTKHSTNVREQRFLCVEKLRGSDSIPGLHAFTIDDTGIQMYPRLLSPRVAPSYQPKVERVNSGIVGLDDMIDKGFWRGSTTLIAGPSGSGKTILAMHFIREGVTRGERGLYVGFQENPSQMARIMHNLGWNATELLENGSFELMYQSPVEMQLDSVAAEVFQRVRTGQISRIVIDALGDLERRSIDRQRFADFIYALTQWFAVENVTCMMTIEMRELFEVSHISDQEVSNMSDNLVLLGYTPGPEMKRTIRIIKTRGSNHDTRQYELDVNDKGVIVKKSK
jgi:circadian clock protein KaiC